MGVPRAGRVGQREATKKALELQIHFARKLGISKSSLNRMELGDQNVSLRSLETLCTRLRCDIAELFPKERR